jgi:AraC-like DNA-binding protein
LGLDADPEFRLMRFSTDQLAPRDRFEIWRDQFSRKLLRMAIDPLNDAPYRAKAALRTLPQMRIGAGSVSPAVHHRSRQTAALENDDLVLLINMAGSYIVRRGGDDIVLGEGDACLLACSDPGDYVMPKPGRHMVIRLSRSVLGAFGRHVELALGRLIPAETEALKLLSAYARSLPRGAWEYSAAVTQAVTTHVGDMVGLVVGASGDAAVIASSRGLAAARLGSIKGHIRERIFDPELSAETVAAAHHISPRYLRQLFEAEDQSFSGYVLDQRLSQAHAMLTCLSLADRPISAIAYDVGFGDLSYFNRAFRRRFERTPRDVRAETGRELRTDRTPMPDAGSIGLVD